MPREISDEEDRYLQGRRQVADFVESIYNDPALSKDAKRLIKRKYPNLAIPDYDIEEKVDQRFADEKKKRDDEDKAARKQKEEDGWKEQRGKVQKEYGFTDEAMTDLEKFMTEKNVGDYEVAATYKASKTPRASEPTSHHGEPWGHGNNETFREIAKDPEAWGRGEIMKALRADQERARQQR